MGGNAYCHSKIPFDDVTSNAETTHFNWLPYIGVHFINFFKGTSKNSSQIMFEPTFSILLRFTGGEGNCVIYTTAQAIFVIGCKHQYA